MDNQRGGPAGDDEPVIGGPSSAAFAEGGPVEPVIGAPARPATPESPADARIGYVPPPPRATPEYAPGYGQDDYGDGYADYDDEYDDGYYDEYGYPYGAPPPRQPLVYVMVAVGVLLIAVLGFLLFTVMSNGGGGGDDDVIGQVVMDAPTDGQRIPVDEEFEVIARASVEEPVQRFELVVNDEVVAEQTIDTPPADNQYRVELATTFEEVGTFVVFVRAVVDAEHSIDSAEASVVVVESLNGGEGGSVRGTVIATVTLRSAPDADAEERGTLDPGDTVRIIGKTRNVDWLLIDRDGGVWIRREAVQVEDSLALVPFAEPTPTPETSPTPTAEPSPSPSPQPTAPDFLPTDAVIVQSGDGFAVRVTVENIASEGYSGVLSVALSGVPVSSGEIAASVDLGPNSSTSFNFPLTAAVTGNTSVTVSVDPDNAVQEQSEDNNSTTFTVTPPITEPEVSLSATSGGGQISVTISNSGGALQSAGTLRLEWNGGASEAGISLNLPTGGSQDVTLNASGATGTTILIRLLVGGVEIAAAEVANPNAQSTPAN